MFGFFKRDPKQKLQQQYEAVLEQAMHSQRNGDLRTYAQLTEQAQAIFLKIQALEK